MAKNCQNVFQRVAAYESVVVVLFGYIKGRQSENPKTTAYQATKDFVKIYNLDNYEIDLYNRYQKFAETFRQMNKERDF